MVWDGGMSTPEDLDWWTSTWNEAWMIWDRRLKREGVALGSGPYEPRDALPFAEGLLLDMTVEQASRRIRRDRAGALAFAEMAHEARDLAASRKWRPVSAIPEGSAGAFYIPAVCVIEWMRWREEILFS